MFNNLTGSYVKKRISKRITESVPSLIHSGIPCLTDTFRRPSWNINTQQMNCVSLYSVRIIGSFLSSVSLLYGIQNQIAMKLWWLGERLVFFRFFNFIFVVKCLKFPGMLAFFTSWIFLCDVIFGGTGNIKFVLKWEKRTPYSSLVMLV